MEDHADCEQHDGISPWITLVVGILVGILLWSGFLWIVGEAMSR